MADKEIVEEKAGETEPIYDFPTGEYYVGEVEDGMPHGLGVMTWPDGDRYEG